MERERYPHKSNHSTHTDTHTHTHTPRNTDTCTYAHTHTHAHCQEGGPEVWLGIKLSCKKRANVRIQFLEEVPEKPGMYTLLAGCETYTY